MKRRLEDAVLHFGAMGFSCREDLTDEQVLFLIKSYVKDGLYFLADVIELMNNEYDNRYVEEFKRTYEIDVVNDDSKSTFELFFSFLKQKKISPYVDFSSDFLREFEFYLNETFDSVSFDRAYFSYDDSSSLVA